MGFPLQLIWHRLPAEVAWFRKGIHLNEISEMKHLDSNVGSRFVSHTGTVLGAEYVIDLNVWPDGATIENVKVTRGADEQNAAYSGSEFIDEAAALAEALETAKTLAGSDEERPEPVGVKSIWGHPVV